MKLPPHLTVDHLDRYFSGHCTPDEAVRVRALILQSRETAALARVVEGEFVDVSALWERFRHSRGLQAPQEAHLPTPRPRFIDRVSHTDHWRRRIPWFIGSLFVLVVAVMLGSKVLVMHRRGSGPLLAAVYETANGQRANITLTDGTHVMLNVASRLEVPANYSSGNHTLRLEGEALFTVVHHDHRPFTVVAGSTTTRVLGTRFVVRSYATDAATTVAVSDGKVAVHSAVRSAVVPQGRQAVLDRNSMHVQTVDPALFSFATGTLMLNGMTLRDAIPELGRWYGAEIRLGDATLAMQRVRGNLPPGSVGDLISLLEMTFNVRVVRDGRVLTLYQK